MWTFNLSANIILDLLPEGGAKSTSKFRWPQRQSCTGKTHTGTHFNKKHYFIKDEAGWLVSLYSIHYVLCNAEDRQTYSRNQTSAGVLTQVQFGVYTGSAVSLLWSDHVCMKEYVVRKQLTGLVTVCSTNLFHWQKKNKNLEHHCTHGHVDSEWICEQWLQTCQQTRLLFFFVATKTKEEKSSN